MSFLLLMPLLELLLGIVFVEQKKPMYVDDRHVLVSLFLRGLAETGRGEAR